MRSRYVRFAAGFGRGILVAVSTGMVAFWWHPSPALWFGALAFVVLTGVAVTVPRPTTAGVVGVVTGILAGAVGTLLLIAFIVTSIFDGLNHAFTW